MKKRVIALLLALIMCLTMIPTTNALAIGQSNVYSEAVTNNIQKVAEIQNFSEWAFSELMIGDTYGIYPVSWYTKGMTSPIKQEQLRVLMAGMRRKMLNSDCTTKVDNHSYHLTKYMTVEDVLKTFHTLISVYEFTEDIGIKDKAPISFMKENGIFTGTNGELSLSDTCTIEQACVFATRLVTYVYDKLDAASKGFLWVTKSGENTVYMLGSIHMASNDIYPFSKKILDAYASSDALALELNIFDLEGATKIGELGVYSDGSSLKDHVSEETYQKTITLATMLGYTEAQIASIKPWYLYSMFSSLATTDSGNVADASAAASLGIDMNFTLNAIIYGKPVLEIEGYEYQGKVLDSFSDELEEYLLSGTIDAVNEVMAGTYTKSSDDLEMMLEYWRDGDATAFETYTSLDYEYPELYEEEVSAKEKALIEEFIDKLITKRDVGMADYIDHLLKAEGSTTYFVVVGSGHYISDYSVLDILKEKGYEMNQIK